MGSWNRLNPAELLLHDASVSLSEEAFGVLMRLSLRALAGVPIPDDEAACRRAAGTRCRDWAATWKEVRAVLVPMESTGIHRIPGRLSWDWIDRLQADTDARLSTDRNRKKLRNAGTEKAAPPVDSNGIHRNPSDSALRTDGRTDVRTEKKENPPTPRTRGKAADAAEVPIPPKLDTPEFREAWAAYEAFRREARYPVLRGSTLRARYAELESWGVRDAVQAIREGILNGWRGLFRPRGPAAAPASVAAPAPDTAAEIRAKRAARDALLAGQRAAQEVGQ